MYYGVIFFLLSVISIYCFYNPSTRYFNKFKTFAFLILFFTSGLRYETAVDWVNYKFFFENVDYIYNIFDQGFVSFFVKYPKEPLFTILNSIVRTFTDNVQVLFFLISLFTTTLLFKSVQNYTKKEYFLFSILLYYVLIFFILDMSGIRQCIALNILFYSFKFLSDNRLKRYLLFVLLASMFHYSAIIFILGMFLRKKIKLSILITLFVFGMIIFLFRIRWMVFSVESLFSLLSDNYIYLRLWSYTVSEGVVSEERPIFIMLFINSFLYFFYLIGRRKYLDKDLDNVIFINLFSLFILSTLFFWEIAEFGVRSGLYFSIGLIISLPLMIEFFTKNSKFFIVSFILLYCFVNIRPYVLEHRSVISYNPYQNYLIYELFEIKSTGTERRDTYVRELE